MNMNLLNIMWKLAVEILYIMYIIPSFSCNNHDIVVRCWFNILAMVLLVKDRKLPVSCIFLSLFSVKKKNSNIALVTSDLLVMN